LDTTDAGRYIVAAKNGCSVKLDTVEVVVNHGAHIQRYSNPNINVNNTAFVCFTDSLEIRIAAQYWNSIRWFFNDNPIVGYDNSLRYSFSNATGADSGLYEVVAYAANGCKNDTSRVNVLITSEMMHQTNLADNNVVNNDTVRLCEGADLELTFSVQNASGYQWYRNTDTVGGFSEDTIFSILAIDTLQEGRYIVEARNSCGALRDTVDVLVTRFARITQQPRDTAPCEGQPLTLTLTAIYADSVIWYKMGYGRVDSGSAFALTDSMVVADTGRYFSIAYHTCKKDTSDTVTVGIRRLLVPEVESADKNLPPMCEGDSLSLIYVVLNSDSMA